jgi:hypothetical protein
VDEEEYQGPRVSGGSKISVLRAIQTLLPYCFEKDLVKLLTNIDPHQEQRNKTPRFQKGSIYAMLSQAIGYLLGILKRPNSRRNIDTNKI